MAYTISVLPGDGIGPEVIAEGIKTLEAVSQKFGVRFNYNYGFIGGVSIDKCGVALTDETVEMCKEGDAVLLGAVGGPKWDDPKAQTRPEDGLLRIRKDLGLFANVRPVKTYDQLIDSTTLKPEVIQGVDMVVIRELTGGLYFAKPKRRWQSATGRRAVDTMGYSEKEIERILRVGFEMARTRRKRLTSVDKANVLESSRLWREIAIELAPKYKDVQLQHMLVDSCAMALVKRPKDFDVIVTENTFGDILTDEAAVLAGSMGMLPSASLGPKSKSKDSVRVFGLYEPIHGSAPDIAGQGKANPIATVLTVAMMLRHSLDMARAAKVTEDAVASVLAEGYRTPDIASPGCKPVGTQEMGNLLANKIRAMS